MSDDLVKRLRYGTAGDKERHKAADRIEKLEAALQKIEYMDRPQVRGKPRRIEIYEVARKALEGKDD